MEDTQKVWEAPKLIVEFLDNTKSGFSTSSTENAWSGYYAIS